jgi:DNA-binding NtrC family response regulator
VDVRIVAATNKDLAGLVKKGFFREDLFYRLNVITIDVPPLRERGDDVLLLANYFVGKLAKESGKAPPRLSDEALQALQNYYWPGNVRELENLMQRLVVMLDDECYRGRRSSDKCILGAARPGAQSRWRKWKPNTFATSRPVDGKPARRKYSALAARLAKS